MNTKDINTSLHLLKEIRDTAHYDSASGICGSAYLYNLSTCSVRAMFETWEHFSGSVDYPIGDYMDADRMYHNTINKYDKSTEYGRLRYKLIDHCIEYLTNLIKER